MHTPFYELARIYYFLHDHYEIIMLFIPLLLLFFPLIHRFNVIPSRFQSMIEALFEFLQSQLRSVFKKEADFGKWMPLFIALFYFILMSNLLGLIPTFHAVTSNINVTGSLAAVIMVLGLFMGLKRNGIAGYFIRLTPHDIAIPFRIMMFPLEIISLISRPLTLAIRLYANTFAGHLLLLILLGLTEMVKSVFFVPFDIFFVLIILMFEIFVALIQAFIFAYLSAAYITDAMYLGENH